MGDTLINEWRLALWSLIVGAFLCVVYDLFRLPRLIKRQSGLMLFVSDLLFCIIASLSMLLLFFNLSSGKMRGYSFALALLGFLAWRFTVSFAVITLLRRLISAVNKLLNSIKMRACAVLNRAKRRIYTKIYCKYAARAAGKLEIKRKGN